MRLQVQRGSSWQTVATVSQDRKGRAQFAAIASVNGQALTYRVIAASFRGLPSIKSSTVSTARWLTPTWTDEFSGKFAFQGLVQPREDLRAPVPSQVLQGERKGGPGGRRRAAAQRPQGSQQAHLVPGPQAWGDRRQVRLPAQRPHRHRRCLLLQVRRRRRPHQVPPAARPARQLLDAAGRRDVPRWHRPRDRRHRVLRRERTNAAASSATSTATRRGRIVKTGATIPDTFLHGPRDGWGKNFHVFSVQWTPRSLIFRIDGKETWRIGGRISQRSPVPHPEPAVLRLRASPDPGPTAPPAHVRRLGTRLGDRRLSVSSPVARRSVAGGADEPGREYAPRHGSAHAPAVPCRPRREPAAAAGAARRAGPAPGRRSRRRRVAGGRGHRDPRRRGPPARRGRAHRDRRRVPAHVVAHGLHLPARGRRPDRPEAGGALPQQGRRPRLRDRGAERPRPGAAGPHDLRRRLRVPVAE